MKCIVENNVLARTSKIHQRWSLFQPDMRFTNFSTFFSLIAFRDGRITRGWNFLEPFIGRHYGFRDPTFKSLFQIRNCQRRILGNPNAISVMPSQKLVYVFLHVTWTSAFLRTRPAQKKVSVSNLEIIWHFFSARGNGKALSRTFA